MNQHPVINEMLLRNRLNEVHRQEFVPEVVINRAIARFEASSRPAAPRLMRRLAGVIGSFLA